MHISICLILLIFLQLDYVLLYDELDFASLCNSDDNKCIGGNISYLCKDVWNKPADRCQDFKFVDLSVRQMKLFLNGHNGIRNKVAEDFKIANMNTVYWSTRLSLMASYYVHECLIEKDKCKLKNEEFRVNQNFLFRERNMVDRWPVRVVRQWYLEIGHDVHTFNDFLYERQYRDMESFTQMTWPLLQYIGCSAAIMFNGYFVLCNYYPPHEIENYRLYVEFGEPCSLCTNTSACSQTFEGLCGIDVPIERAETKDINPYLILGNILCIITFKLLKQILLSN